MTMSRRRTFISTLNTFIARPPAQKVGQQQRTQSTNSVRAPDEKAWLKILAKYRTPHAGRSVFELTIKAIPFTAFWTLTRLAVHYGFWWGLILIVPAAGFLLRLFAIQHDCGHGSFFARRRFDDWTGRVLGVLTLDSGMTIGAGRMPRTTRLPAGPDERGVGDITTLTVTEYYGRSRWGRIGYRLYRHPLVMFAIGPVWFSSSSNVCRWV